MSAEPGPPSSSTSTSGQPAVRVVLADDQEMIREGLAALLGAQPGLEVVGTAADGTAVVDLVRATRPDVVLMDVRMPRMDGIAATEAIVAAHALGAGPKVVVLTTFGLDEYVYAALCAGASGYLLKHAPTADLVHAVRTVARGGTLLAPEVTRRLIEHFVATGAPMRLDEGRLTGLTSRERDILVHVARGLSNAEIARELFLAEQTVKSHVSRIFTKLGVRDRAQAVVVAYDSGLVRPAERERG